MSSIGNSYVVVAIAKDIRQVHIAIVLIGMLLNSISELDLCDFPRNSELHAISLQFNVEHAPIDISFESWKVWLDIQIGRTSILRITPNCQWGRSKCKRGRRQQGWLGSARDC